MCTNNKMKDHVLFIVCNPLKLTTLPKKHALAFVTSKRLVREPIVF